MKIKNLNISLEISDALDIVSEKALLMRFKKENIVLERIDLYLEFLNKLSFYLNSTYFGKEDIKTTEDIIGHFNWGFNKVSDEINLYIKNFNVKNNNSIRTALFTYYLTNIYENDNWIYEEESITTHFFNIIMSNKENKTHYELDIMIDLYKCFDESFK